MDRLIYYSGVSGHRLGPTPLMARYYAQRFSAKLIISEANKRNVAMSVHVIAAIPRVILNHEDEHIVGALAGRDLQHNKTVISS